MKRKYRNILLILVASLFAFSANTFAQGIKERMKERLPIIEALKGDGVIGENNSGYLEFLGPKKPKEEVVKAENADRALIYSAIAKKQGTSAELVGKRRAAKIFEIADPGEWIQDAQGNWIQKK